MLIAIDGFEASASERVGVGRLEVELLKALSKVDKSNSYRIYTPNDPKVDLPKSTDHWKYISPSFKRLWSQVALPWKLILDKPKPDVFFAPVHYAPRYCPFPTVVGIMDLSFIHFPELFRGRDLYKLKNWTKYSVESAKAVIAISRSTKNDILKTYNVSEALVHVVYPGVQISKSKSQMSNKFQNLNSKYGIMQNYILYVGTLQPRKNIVRLIEAFKKVRSYKLPIANLQLVIVGKKGWMYDEILEKAKELGIENSVIFTGFVPDNELTALYSNALCFCLPSLYEGFGFPVLEAMQNGCPVVASNVSSLPELVGDAGVLVDPKSVESIAKGIEKILSISDVEKNKLVERGKKQVGKFTWEKAAKQTLDIIETVGNER